MKEKAKDSRFEIIRILSMIFIVSYHYTMYGGWKGYNSLDLGDKLALLYLL